MSKPQKPPKALLFASLIYLSAETRDCAAEMLSKDYGPIACKSPEMEFDRTDYYEVEMGKALKRVFLGFETLVERDALAEKKIYALSVEDAFRREGKRTVNIDPGLLSFENVLLSTCKNFSHRIYLGRGVFAEVTLIYENGKFESLKWTYPDYDSSGVKSVLSLMREKYKELSRCQNG